MIQYIHNKRVEWSNVMNKFREKLTTFMYGRYGMDQLGKVLIYASLIFLVLSMIFRLNLFYFIDLLGLIYGYFRMFSKRVDKRYQENQKFMNWRYKMVCKISQFKSRMADRKTHRIFKCPNCSQKIRVPKGKGKICIKCPKCRIEFIKKT